MADPDLSPGQFALGGFKFGGEQDAVLVVPDTFDTGVTGNRVQDSENPVGDTWRFGRDKLTPGVWSWKLNTNRYNAADALDALDRMASVWRGENFRHRANQMQTLRYNLSGETRRVYGRSRRWAQGVDARLWQGIGVADCDFQLVSAETYADEARTVTVSILPSSSIGLTSPLIGTLSTTAGGETWRSIPDVGGRAPAPFEAVIYGPVEDPYISEDGWTIQLNTTLAYDQYAVIDTRPGKFIAYRNDGASLGGALSRTSRLSLARLRPGGSTVRYGGKDSTGTSRMAITWRPTYYSI